MNGNSTSKQENVQHIVLDDSCIDVNSGINDGRQHISLHDALQENDSHHLEMTTLAIDRNCGTSETECVNVNSFKGQK